MEEKKPDLLRVMERAGVRVDPRGDRANIMLRCPFHRDTGRPNMSVSLRGGLFHCFRCGRGGDVYDFQGLLIYGDAVLLRDTLQFLPMEAVTLLESRSQIQDLSAQIFEDNIAVLNEFSDDLRKVYTKKRFVHFTLDPTPYPVKAVSYTHLTLPTN